MDKETEMKQIRDEILSLSASPLYTYRAENNYFPVIGEGDHNARIVFVGEAPGEKEAQSARPFCGRSGKFLDELLGSIGLGREKVYITNLVKDRPPENRDPTPEEIALYSPFLDRQIKSIKPAVIVMLGRYSMKYLFEKAGIKDTLQPISKIHGELFDGDFGYGQVKLIPLYHPAVALYNPNMRAVLFEDFKKVGEFK
ncbi:MAG: hypothetical protein RIQ41_478 [Candidatus Parcubacteria bacterium]|jgi:DNA polymerase